jgi:hypothetical protein
VGLAAIRFLFEYDRWATERLFTHVESRCPSESGLPTGLFLDE